MITTGAKSYLLLYKNDLKKTSQIVPSKSAVKLKKISEKYIY